MPSALLNSPTYQLQPSATRVPLATSYITNFDFLNQYLPDTYEKEFERYGNRTVSSFLRMVGAELPSNSDQVKWAEQGRLHIKYVNVNANSAPPSDTATFTVNDTAVVTAGNGQAIRVGQTVMIQANNTGLYNKGIVTAATQGSLTFTVAFYEGGGQTFPQNSTVSVFVYGSEFKKGQTGMVGSLEAEDEITPSHE